MRVILFPTLCTINSTTATDQAYHNIEDIVATMSKTVHIESTAQFSSLIASSKIVVADCRQRPPASSTAKR
jgi:hypothetical protein